MLKEKIEYIDYNGNKVETVEYFNLSIVEVTKLEAEFGTDVESYTKMLAESGDLNKMIQFLERLILGAYGRKSEDGSRFVKKQEWTQEFEQSAAYAEMFVKLLSEPEYAKHIGASIVTNTKPNINQNGVAAL